MKTRKHPKFTEELLPTDVRREVDHYYLGRRVVTTVRLFNRNNDNNMIGKGASVRNPIDWNDKKMGEKVALGRAVKDYWLNYRTKRSSLDNLISDVHTEGSVRDVHTLGDLNEV